MLAKNVLAWRADWWFEMQDQTTAPEAYRSRRHDRGYERQEMSLWCEYFRVC